jgi:hypothetical protein
VGIRLDGSSSLMNRLPGAITSNLVVCSHKYGKELQMSDALLVGLISAGVTLVGIVVSLVGIFVSAKNTKDEVTQKLDTNQKLMKQDIDHIKTDMSQMKLDIQKEMCEMKEDVRSHNHYAKLFSDNIPAIKEIPVIKEKISIANKRLGAIEDDVRFYHRRPED